MKKLTRQSLDEMAKTLPVIEKKSQTGYVGGGNGTSAEPYTYDEYDNLLSYGSWNGGYVEGIGYVNADAYVYGSSSYPNGVSQEYLSFPDYLSSLSSTGLDRLLNELLGVTPLGILTSHATQDLINATTSIQKELLERGYDASSSFNFVRTDMGNGTKISVFDANTGQFIISKVIGE